MNRNQSLRLRSFVLTVVAVLAGGSAFTSCDTRMKSAVLGGAENFVYGLLDPSLWLPVDSGQPTGTTESDLP
jgi:hypothetical protein